MAEENKKNPKSAAKKGASQKPKQGGTGNRRPAAGKAKPVKSAPSGSGWNPFAVLTIMALATAIVVMANRFYSSKPVIKKSAVEEARHEEPQIKPLPVVKEEPKIVPADKKPEDKAVREASVKIYFIRLDEKTEKFYLASVARKVRGNSMLKDTLDELIKGPSTAEERKGYLSAVPETLKIRKVSVSNRTALVDFNSAIETGAAGNVLIHRIDQIVYTATQFDTVDSLVIMVDGKRKNSLGGDGLSISGPLHRKQ
ncbi:MAG TPA: GerMN domain-containing protein [Spirochaetota bacterium]|nr:GerMN domain-containing protein [Spirochaetota bacterium]HPI90134.1 GerMN domain-containing protein [Spirochaetota bacterium]HPR49150.1 GerMN domain-containing protein [Spirochaetota bacterium]